MILENAAELQSVFTQLKLRLQQRQVRGAKNHATLLGQIDSALERLTKGTYGICNSCFLVMPKGDLLRRPFDEQCSRCRRSGKREPVGTTAQASRSLI